MRNRVSIAPKPALQDQRPQLAGTSLTMSADWFDGGADSVGLCESWRAWEAGRSSEFLNHFLFTPHSTSSTAETEVLEDWICFQDGSSELDDRARAILGDNLKLFRANPTMRIVIGGRAGPRGTLAHGMRLGLKRVLSIRIFLLAHGIDPNRIGVAVRGSDWSLAERCAGSMGSRGQGGECRFQVTDPKWLIARN